MKILDIYEKYQIMPQLALHMLRVAGVAKQITDNLSEELDRENVVLAALLHDMGNIIKFDLVKTAKFVGEGFDLSFWENVQKDFFQRFGRDEHHATLEIVRELGFSGRVVELIDSVGFEKINSVYETDDFGKKICEYADMRVNPFHVCSMEERLLDLRARYDQKTASMPGGHKRRDEFENMLRGIEKQIFAKCSIAPQDITEESSQKLFDYFKNMELFVV